MRMCCAQARDKYCIERHQRATSNTTQSMHEENMTINQAGRRIGCRHNILSTPTPMLAPVLILGTVGRAHGQTLCRFFYLKSSVVQKIKSESKSAHVLLSKGGIEVCTCAVLKGRHGIVSPLRKSLQFFLVLSRTFPRWTLLGKYANSVHDLGVVYTTCV